MGSIIDGLFGGGDAASEAADIQAQASQEAVAEQRRQFGITQKGLEPFRKAADPALQQYMALLGLGGTQGTQGTQFTPVQQALSYDDWAARQGTRGARTSAGARPYAKGDTFYVPQSMVDQYGGLGSQGLGKAAQEYMTSPMRSSFSAGDIELAIDPGTAASRPQDTSRSAYDRYVQGLAGRAGTQGQGALDAQQAAFASLTESPGQQFIRERAQRGLLQNTAALGGIGGGNVRSELVQQGAGFAAQDLENRYGRLQNLISGGQNAAAQQGQFGAQSASNIGNLLQSGAQARASGILGAQQAKSSGLSNLIGLGTALYTGGAFGGLGGFGGAASGLSSGAQTLSQAYAPDGLLFSDERLKTDIQELDLEDCYNAVMNTPLKAWRYLEETGLDQDMHMGMMAQDAPGCIRGEDVAGYKTLDLHDELTLIMGALQYAHIMNKVN